MPQVIYLGAVGLSAAGFLTMRNLYLSIFKRWVIPGVVTALFLLAAYASVSRLEKDTNVTRALKPANQNLTQYLKDAGLERLETNRIYIFFGNCVQHIASSKGRLPFVVMKKAVADRMFWETLLEVNLSDRGAAISGQFLDESGKVVAVLKNNVPLLGPSGFNLERPDDSTLIIHDQSNNEVVNIRFLATNAFWFNGIFRSRNGGEVVVQKDAVVITKGLPIARLHRIQNKDGPAVCVDGKFSEIGLKDELPLY